MRLAGGGALAVPRPIGTRRWNPWPTGPVKLLRKPFDVRKPVTSARLYATALGAYAAAINGERVGDQVLAPGWTDYREHVPYQAYDVTAYGEEGANAMARTWRRAGIRRR